MNPLIIGAIVAAILTLLLIIANEVFGLLSSDRFPSAAHRYGAYVWFALLAYFLATNVAGSAQGAAEFDATQVRFWTIFALHATLILFLFGWWTLADRKPLLDFMNLRSDDLYKDTAIGLVAGLGAWLFMVTAALSVSLVADYFGWLPEDLQPAPMIDYMVNLAWWKKALIVFSAMTVEEFFFRGWMQKRFGLIVSTLIFAISHAGYGQPLFMVGVLAVSLVIGVTFYFTRRLWPCIIAHGVFDAIQLFVIAPVVTRTLS